MSDILFNLIRRKDCVPDDPVMMKLLLICSLIGERLPSVVNSK